MNAEHINYGLLYNPRLTVKGFPQIVERRQRDARTARAQLVNSKRAPTGKKKGGGADAPDSRCRDRMNRSVP